MPGVLGPPTHSKSRGPATIQALTDQALSSVSLTGRRGPQDEQRVLDSRACLPSRATPSSGVLNWSPTKGQQLTIKTVVSDHIDLSPFSFCPFTV